MTNVLLNHIHSLYNKVFKPTFHKRYLHHSQIPCDSYLHYNLSIFRTDTFVPRSELLVLMMRSAFGHPD